LPPPLSPSAWAGGVDFVRSIWQVRLAPARLTVRLEQPKAPSPAVSKGKEAANCKPEVASGGKEGEASGGDETDADVHSSTSDGDGAGLDENLKKRADEDEDRICEDEEEEEEEEGEEDDNDDDDDTIRLEVVNESDEAVAPFVFLQSEETKGRFSDNGFLLLPRTTRRVRFYPQVVAGPTRKRSANESAKDRLEEERRKRAAAFLAQCSVTSLHDSYAK
jgi:hypothetical protein